MHCATAVLAQSDVLGHAFVAGRQRRRDVALTFSLAAVGFAVHAAAPNTVSLPNLGIGLLLSWLEPHPSEPVVRKELTPFPQDVGPESIEMLAGHFADVVLHAEQRHASVVAMGDSRTSAGP
jgi:hypothetical protein